MRIGTTQTIGEEREISSFPTPPYTPVHSPRECPSSPSEKKRSSLREASGNDAFEGKIPPNWRGNSSTGTKENRCFFRFAPFLDDGDVMKCGRISKDALAKETPGSGIPDETENVP